MTERQITAVILAGGRGSRLGGADKGLIRIAGREMVDYLIEALRPQVSDIVIVANRHRSEYERFGQPVLSDAMPGYQGPLAGILTALEYSTTPCLLCLPCDAPLLAPDYATRMLQGLESQSASASVAEYHGRWQSVNCLLKAALKDSVEQALCKHDATICTWLQSIHAASVDFSDKPEQFENINNEADLERLEKLLTANYETV